MSVRVVNRVSQALGGRFSRRSFLGKAALVGSAVVVAKSQYVLRPLTAYAAVCDCKGRNCSCGSRCCQGWTEFCCSLYDGVNTCPPGTFAAGWWKAHGSQFCDGARYYIDCNAECRCGGGPGFCPHCDGHHCHCGGDDCGRWGVACNVFRYGQCHQEQARAGRIVCRVVSCTPPWLIDETCTRTAATANATANHNAPCTGTAPAVALLSTASGDGYWMVDREGEVDGFGDASDEGSVPGLRRSGAISSEPVVTDGAAVAAGSRRGYWVVDSLGGVFAFGDVAYHGSIPQRRQEGQDIGHARVVGVAPTPTGNGYWLLDHVGGVFTFGDARYFGSIPQRRREGQDIGHARVVGIAPTPTGNGYWLLDHVGGVFTFGDARYFGSLPARGGTTSIVVSITATPDGDGYWMVTETGGVARFGDARHFGER